MGSMSHRNPSANSGALLTVVVKMALPTSFVDHGRVVTYNSPPLSAAMEP